MAEHGTPGFTGQDRCWPCAVVNSVVGFVVAIVPLLAAVARGEAVFVALSIVWALSAAGYTVYRLASKGYLPYAETIARRTGLHDRIGPR